MTEYYESCYDCYSIKLTVRVLGREGKFDRVAVTCTDCGVEWEDLVEVESDE